jgi:serine/threonine-protein kinase RsbW
MHCPLATPIPASETQHATFVASPKMERSFSRTLDSLSEVVSFIDDYSQTRVPGNLVPVVQLVVEEIFTNMVRHNTSDSSGPDDDITVSLDRNGLDLAITLTDLHSDRFDIREQKTVDVSAPLEDRKPGGLGIHLVRHMVDEIHYHYKDGVSVITLIKKLDASDA